MSRARFHSLAALALLLSLAVAFEVGAGEPSARDAVLITVDTLRADALGFAGNRAAATPVLDRLAAGGRVFTDAHAHSVTTLPSHASILTGLYPFEHGARHNGGFVLAEGMPTLATRLSAAGFATAAFVGAFPLDARFGLAQGFDVYDDDFGTPDSLFQYSERRGDAVVVPALAWWRAHRGERRFLWLHLFDPHAPYEPPEPYRTRFADAPYLGEVAAVDAFLAPLLEGFLAGREAPALIVFTSDHGEALGEHGEATHGLFAYEPTLKVPLVLWGAGVERGRDARPARHVDLLPTVLAALGQRHAPSPASISAFGERLPGRSLLAPAGGHPDESFFEALSGNLDYGWAPLRGVLAGGRKLIALPIPELYDLRSDPGEETNLYAGQQGAARALARLLPAESGWPPGPGTLSSEEAARLRSLGYLSGPTAKRTRYTAADDPKTLLPLDHKVTRLAELAAAGAVAEAVALGEEILAARPSMGLVYVYLSTLLVQSGDHERAIGVMRRAREQGVAGRELSRQLGLTLIEVGRPKEALEVLDPLLAEDPADVEAANHRALAVAGLGRPGDARSILERLAAEQPEEARTFENLSFLAVLSGRYEQARDQARKALAIDPGLVSSWNNLGIALYNLGSPGEALDAWERGLAVAPDDVETLLNAGLVGAEHGDRRVAGERLRRFLEVASGAGYEVKRGQAREVLEGLGSAG